MANGFYPYDPNVGSNAFFLAATVLLALVVPYLGFRSWTPLFSATLTTGLLAEALGFIGRVLLHSEGDNETYLFLCLLGTVLGPTFISIAIFVVLSHILRIYGDHISPIRPLVVGIVFWSLGIIVLIGELIGTIIVAYIKTRRHSGTSLLAVMLGVQTAFLLACSGLHFWFTLGLITRRGTLDIQHHEVYTSIAFKKMTLAIEMASLLLIVYSVYRTVEFATGLSGTLYQSEPTFMVLSGAVPLMAAILLTAFHPGPIFGDAWAETTPSGFARNSQPSLVLHTNGHATHHRYDPDIRKQHSPMSQRPLRGSIGPPASSPGLPANPRPVSKPSSPQAPQRVLSIMTTKESAERVERKSVPAPPRRLVDDEGLW